MKAATSGAGAPQQPSFAQHNTTNAPTASGFNVPSFQFQTPGPSSFGTSAFRPQTQAFSAPSHQASQGFGQAQQQTTPSFHQAHHQTSTFGGQQTTHAFGQPSSQATSAFGQPSSQATSAFGQPSSQTIGTATKSTNRPSGAFNPPAFNAPVQGTTSFPATQSTGNTSFSVHSDQTTRAQHQGFAGAARGGSRGGRVSRCVDQHTSCAV